MTLAPMSSHPAEVMTQLWVLKRKSMVPKIKTQEAREFPLLSRDFGDHSVTASWKQACAPQLIKRHGHLPTRNNLKKKK